MSLHKLQLNNSLTINEVANLVKSILQHEFEIVEEDLNRPWGGFLKIADNQIEKFIQDYFPDAQIPNLYYNLSPKFMLWAPGRRLSWQVHSRRSELWKIIQGPAGAYLSPTDTQPENPQVFQEGETVNIPQGIRHRSGGLDNWAIIAEIWVHTNSDNLSDENDIRRIEDDYGRKT